MSISIFIICWPGVEENAREIASRLSSHRQNVFVIYSKRNNAGSEHGPGTWINTPDSWYYGRKLDFILSLNLVSDVILQIHADVTCADWNFLVNRCEATFSQIEKVGIWGPLVDGTYWTDERVCTGCIERADQSFLNVTITDTMVWAISSGVQEFLRSTNLTQNNHGWGVDWAASAYAYSNNLLVVRDKGVQVKHPMGTGYSSIVAAEEEKAYLSELNPNLLPLLNVMNFYSRRHIFLSTINSASDT